MYHTSSRRKRSTYRGGDLEGNECWRLLRHAVPALDAVKALLVTHLATMSAEEKEKRANIEEINLFIRAFQRLFQYMDVMSHYCYQPMGSLTDKDLAAVDRCVFNAATLWQNLMPTVPMKVHAWQHMREDLLRLGGLKSHNEHGIERSHQAAVRDNKRLAAIRDFEKKTLNILQHDATVKAPEVVAMHKDTRSKQKKRKKHASTAETTEQRKDYINSVVSLPELQQDVPTLIALAKQSHRQTH